MEIWLCNFLQGKSPCWKPSWRIPRATRQRAATSCCTWEPRWDSTRTRWSGDVLKSIRCTTSWVSSAVNLATCACSWTRRSSSAPRREHTTRTCSSRWTSTSLRSKAWSGRMSYRDSSLRKSARSGQRRRSESYATRSSYTITMWPCWAATASWRRRWLGWQGYRCPPWRTSAHQNCQPCMLTSGMPRHPHKSPVSLDADEELALCVMLVMCTVTRI